MSRTVSHVSKPSEVKASRYWSIPNRWRICPRSVIKAYAWSIIDSNISTQCYQVVLTRRLRLAFRKAASSLMRLHAPLSMCAGQRPLEDGCLGDIEIGAAGSKIFNTEGKERLEVLLRKRRDAVLPTRGSRRCQGALPLVSNNGCNVGERYGKRRKIDGNRGSRSANIRRLRGLESFGWPKNDGTKCFYVRCGRDVREWCDKYRVLTAGSSRAFEAGRLCGGRDTEYRIGEIEPRGMNKTEQARWQVEGKGQGERKVQWPGSGRKFCGFVAWFRRVLCTMEETKDDRNRGGGHVREDVLLRSFTDRHGDLDESWEGGRDAA